MKKKAFQKLTALLAVTAMSASLLTGCGSDASGSNDAATNNAKELSHPSALQSGRQVSGVSEELLFSAFCR